MDILFFCFFVFLLLLLFCVFFILFVFFSPTSGHGTSYMKFSEVIFIALMLVDFHAIIYSSCSY